MIELTIGFLLDIIIGDPNNPFHPVRGIGYIAKKFEALFRKILKKSLKTAGFLTWIFTILIVFAITFEIVSICKRINVYFGVIIEGILIYFCIASKGLVVEGYKVIKFLMKDDIDGARKQLSFIVGRDTGSLSREGIIKAVVETIAENMADGIIAPLFYAGIFGAPLAFAYKAVNTMDSMFGYKNDKYMEFGYFPAKLDDIFNYIPARVTGVLIIIAAGILGYDYKNSFKIYKRDRHNHTSPNSAHPEAAMAGALGVELGGANFYFGKLVEKPTIGDKIKEIEIRDVDKTARVLYLSSFIGFVLAILIKGIISYSTYV
ncbi:adenosylcobinamide-phosphate synthase [Clostridium saccharoperbutylacetonicum]|uniref:Cobalamin biosynthesis protein CobD n=1 Tax=Clostridium saccharoperbutylacetonicum N1-4(HMT) TaxID=931276 RepID=M1MFW2_9CLOT|nr:adenosylcobinamide-phosphate synthase CbiB [Clostridium saccharoperbutylacetonicum]AGF55238.1 cobalamin biosynthesis protein CobD [Clostridium saccharoperbutylacetonicum N1-4(HMT)]NRT64051.1 adenosylcobinamide-phosphate synthase [Clostridium saccharoperbutylacetonicum]NSB27418.1 adenosylcobinamide-phosphate synthase [Clostridium saccharoperbutylacetonicum]NSB40907.1 adenosylcobinamide-phosphate synthase [Clostridium saccharoperbutylacetonicum]